MKTGEFVIEEVGLQEKMSRSLSAKGMSDRDSPGSYLLDLGRFTQVFGAIGLAAAGKAVKLRIAGYLLDLFVEPIAAQHAQMSMMVRSAAAF